MGEDLIRAWRRADGWTEIEWPGGSARYRTPAEADAHIAGMKAGLGLAKATVERHLSDFSDERTPD